MKKRVIALLLAGVLVLSNGVMVLAEEPVAAEAPTVVEQTVPTADEADTTVVPEGEEKEAKTEEASPEAVPETEEDVSKVSEGKVTEEKATEVAEKQYKYVSAAEARAKAGEGDVILVDTRLAADYAAGHLKGAVSVPSRTSKDDSAKVETEALKVFANTALKGNNKKVYIICYSGNRFAQVATDVFAEVLGSDDRLYTVEGGMVAIGTNDLKKDAYITIEHAVANAKSGKGTIVDVRTKENFNKGHIEGSLFATVANGDSDKDAFLKAVKDIDEMYILCNTGSSLAERAQSWLKGSGKKVFTVTGGHDKNLDSVEWVSWNYVSAADAVAKAGKTDVILVDTRQPEAYAEGHIKGAVNVPAYLGDVTDANLQGESLKAFAELNLKGNKKNVYIICYSGNRYAQAATAEFVKVLGNDDRLFTVEGGMGAITAVSEYKDLARTDAYITLDAALANKESGKGIILDVRSEEFYKSGHIEGSEWITVTNAKDDNDAAAKKEFVDAVNKLDEGKELYVLCNTGSSLAERAQKWLAETRGNVYTIVGGHNLNLNGPWVIDYNFVSAEKAVEKAGKTDVILVDTRQPEAYAAGHIKGAVNVPAYLGEVTDANLQTAALKAFAEVNLKGNTKDVYIICYSGNRYAQAATKVFTEVRGSNKNIFTVEGGMQKVEAVEAYAKAKRTDAYVTMASALANKDNVIILDVRDPRFYTQGHIVGSEWATVYTGNEKTSFQNYAKTFEKGKPIYIICNTGSSLAERAQEWLHEMKIENPLYTVTGGHNLNPDAPWSTNREDTNGVVDHLPVDKMYVSAEEAAKAALSGDAIVLDVRPVKDYGDFKGYGSEHMEGTINVPVFGPDFSSPDDVVAALTKYAEENLANSTKPIYVVCYVGTVGVWRTAAALMDAGIDATRIYGVTGGQAELKKAPSYKEVVVGGTTNKPSTNKPSANKPSKTPKTGDVAPIAGLVVVMGVAAGVAVVAIKKKRTF